MSDHEQGGDAAGARRRASRARTRLLWIGGAVAVVLAVVLGTLLWANWSAKDVQVITVLGVEYSSNVPIEEQNGYVYVYLPVNSDTAAVIVEVSDEGDSRRIRDFLDSLDTFVPGEHVLDLSDSNLHFIVDGMAEE